MLIAYNNLLTLKKTSMKKSLILTFAACIICYTFSYAQKLPESKVPAAVKAAMAKKYPNVTKVTWTTEEKDFESEFKQDGKEMSAIFNPSGTWKETETAIAFTALPQPVKQYLDQHFKGKKIKETAMINKADGSVAYEAEINNTDYVFDTNGKLIKKEMEGENEKD
jgi:hypothetical protein